MIPRASILALNVSLLFNLTLICGHPHSVLLGQPTISPYPTETAAPSPSPSDFPTDTQSPSHSLVPSNSPSSFPTTDEPSEIPTENPTESPAPSPAPSELPSLHPSDRPSLSFTPSLSRQPSPIPTTSKPSGSPTLAPNPSPTIAPSEIPTLSAEPTITPRPTGHVFLVAQNVKVIFQGVTRDMTPIHVEIFEEETKLLLQHRVHWAPGVVDIEIEAITVSAQKLMGVRRLDSINPQPRGSFSYTPSLVVTIQVVASAILSPSENFDLKLFLEIYFENIDNLQELRDRLEQEDIFSQEIYWGDDSTGSRTVGGSVAGTFFGVVVSFVGFVGIRMWTRRPRRRKRKLEHDKDPHYSQQLESFHSYDTDDCVPPTRDGTISTSLVVFDTNKFETNQDFLPNHGQNQIIHSQFHVAEEKGEDDATHDMANTDMDELVESVIQPSRLMCTPALMTTENNIEVPETPQTAFFTIQGAASGFITPASGLAKSVYSFNSNPIPNKSKIPPSTENMDGNARKYFFSEKSKRKPHFPHIWKSPFRRESTTTNTNGMEDENDVDDDSDVVAFPGHRSNPRQRERKQHDRHEANSLSTGSLPSEIGGPESVPAIVFPPAVTRDECFGIVDEVTYLYSNTKGKNDDW